MMQIYTVDFIGANPTTPIGMSPSGPKVAHFYGRNPLSWSLGARTYQEVLYRNLYDNIDLTYRFTDMGLKYEFIVRPGGDPSEISMRYNGVVPSTDGTKLLIATSLGNIVEDDLVSYQVDEGRQRTVVSSFVVEHGLVSFDVEYDQSQTLVIDPLIYSTYLSGTMGEMVGYSRVKDSKYLVGMGATASADFPVTPGCYDSKHNGGNDVIVFELNEMGTDLVFATFIGGVGDDSPRGMALDSLGNILITGGTVSTDFPTTNGVYDTTYGGGSEAFVVKLSSDGTKLIYSTFLGGSDFDYGTGINVDSSDRVIVSGVTRGGGFPTTAGAYDTTFNGDRDTYVTKFNDQGTGLVFSTLFGGSNMDYPDAPNLDTDANGNIFVTGHTTSNDMPTSIDAMDRTYNGNFDVFVFKLAADGSSMFYSTYFGGTSDDYSENLAVDPSGKVFVVGYSASQIPTTPDAFDPTWSGTTAYFFRLNDNGSLNYSSYLGNDGYSYAETISFDGPDIVYIAGTSRWGNIPITSDAYDNQTDNADGFFCILNITSATMDYATYFGSSGDDWIVSMDVDLAGQIFLFGQTISTEFPTTPGAFQDKALTTGTKFFATKFQNPHCPWRPSTVQVTEFDSALKLDWALPNHTGRSPLTGFNVYRGDSAVNLSFLSYLAYDGVSTKFFLNDTGLINGKTYFYAISSLNSYGEGARSWPVSGSPWGSLGPLYNLTASGHNKRVQLVWEAPSKDGGFPVLGYHVLRGNGTDVVEFYKTLGVVTQMNDTNVVNGVIYYYKVCAFNLKGNSSFLKANAIPGSVPSAPTNLARVWGNGFISLTWAAPKDNGGFPLVNYDIYRGNSTSNLTKRYSIPKIEQFNDTNVTNGVSYYYAVSGSNIRGEGPLSGSIGQYPGSVPNPPENILTTVGDGFVNISWKAPTFNGGFPVTKYHIYRAENGSEPIPFMNPVSTSLNDTIVENFKSYYYTISSSNFLGEGKMSDPVEAHPGISPPAPTVVCEQIDLGIVLTWEVRNNTGLPIEFYQVFRGMDNITLDHIGSTVGGRYTDMNVTIGTTYYYSVSATSKFSSGPRSVPISIKVTPANSVPKAILVSPADGERIPNGGVSFSWLAHDTDGDEILSDLFFSASKDKVLNLDPSSKIATRLGTSNYSIIVELVNEQDYYWTVIPSDDSAPGICVNGPFRFSVATNGIPSLDQVTDIETKVGEKLTVQVKGQDPDIQDAQKLRFGLNNAPAGMTINETNGTIIWTPDPSQVGTHVIEVTLNDGKASTSMSFHIKVTERTKHDDQHFGTSAILGIFIAVVAVSSVVGVIGFILYRKKKSQKGP